MKVTFKIEQVSVSTDDENVVLEGIELDLEMSVDEMIASANETIKAFSAFSAAETNDASNSSSHDIAASSHDEEFVAYVLYKNGYYAAYGSEGWTFTRDPKEATLFDTMEKAELRQRSTPQYAAFNIIKRVKEII